MALGNICFCIHFLRVKTNRNIHLAVCGFPTFRYLTGWGWWEWWDVRINSSSFSLPFPQIIRIHRSQERPSGRKLRCTGGTVQWQTPAYMVGRGGISDGPAFHKDGLRQWVQGKARVLSRYPFRTPMHKHWYISSLPCTRKTCHFVDCFGSEECFGNGIADAFCKLNNLIWIIIITASNFWDKTKVLSEGEQGGGDSRGVQSLTDLLSSYFAFIWYDKERDRHNQDLHGKHRLLWYTFWERRLTKPFTSLLFSVLHSQQNWRNHWELAGDHWEAVTDSSWLMAVC